MKNYYQPFSLLFCFFLSSTFAFSQSDFVATGGNSTNNQNGSVSFSIGQTNYSYKENNGTINEGVQQPFEFFVVSSALKSTERIDILAYPNPTRNHLTISVQMEEIKDLEYQLYDFQGKLLSRKRLVEDNTLLDLEGLPTSNYLLNISDPKGHVYKSIKIIKNN